MGYRIGKIDYGIGWKLKFESYVGGIRVNKDILKDRWASLGFYLEMGKEAALSRCQTLNKLYTAEENKRRAIDTQARIEDDKLKFNGIFPDQLVSEFETILDILVLDKWKSHWFASQKCILNLNLIDPSLWCDNTKQIYNYFKKNHWSISYTQKILYIMNKWGYFYCKKLKIHFEPIKPPRGRDKEVISDARFDAKGSQISDPITPDMLDTLERNLKLSQYRWIYLSTWFGLRPNEVDLLSKPTSVSTWSIEEWKEYKVLKIYQNKLITIPREKRFKRIPCITKDQLIGLSFIGPNLTRPLSKTLKRYLKGNITCYGGRKGFVSLMLNKGYTLEKISRWLGHQSIERTWRDYTLKTEDLV